MKRIPCLCFSIAACLLIAMTGCTGYGPSEREKALMLDQNFIQAVQAAGGTAAKQTFKKYGQEGQAWVIDLHDAQIDDELVDMMCQIGQVSYIGELDLGGSSITNEQLLKLDAIKACRATMELDLSNTSVDDTTLDKIANFNCLQNAKLAGTKVTSQGVSRFKAKRKSNNDVPLPFKNPKMELK